MYERSKLQQVLITGVAGFIGSHLAEKLLKQGCQVIGVDSFTDYYSRELKLKNLARIIEEKNFCLVEEDLLQMDLGKVMQKVDNIVHLAAQPGVRASWGDNFHNYLSRNVETTQRLLEELPLDSVERFIFASSSSVYGSIEEAPVREGSQRVPASPYGLSKLAAEELVQLYVRERKVPATILRYFTVYGPRQRPDMALSRFISAVLQGETLQVFGDGEQMREMTYVSDVVEATVAAMRKPAGGIYNVGGGVRATINELIDQVERALGIEAVITHQPFADGDVRSTWADLTLVTQQLDYKPQVGLEAGVKAQVKWMLEESSFTPAIGGSPRS